MTRFFCNIIIWCGLLVLCLVACRRPQVPQQYVVAGTMPKTYPDYAGVTVPVNMAPLCFELMAEADEAVTRFTAGGRELVVGGRKCRPGISEWHQLLKSSAGGDITVEVFAAKDGSWVRYKPFSIHVSNDSIDPYLCFRLISPSYVSYEELTINQRCLENFDERVIADNMLCSNESGGQCINCHSFQSNNPERMQLHARQSHGGTLISYDGETVSADLSLAAAKHKTPAVYPAWHPREKLIAYSTNTTMQAFHTADPDKIEVYDSESALALYDIDRHELTAIEHVPDELETYPAWSPDGRWLYYCSAHFEYEADSVDAEEVTLRCRELKYNIYRGAFNSDTRSFGPRCLVFDAASRGMSAAHPRISPDGRWLLFSMSEYGTFHIWHRDADLWMIELGGDSLIAARNSSVEEEGGVDACKLDEVNSDETESYHSWSSNGRWIVFSSRRHDGVFTRPFFAHIDNDGKASKPFELPMSDPDHHLQLMKSYNVPEFIKAAVRLTPQQVAKRLSNR